MTEQQNAAQLLSFTPDNFQFAWDATSVSAFEKCPRYYYYAHIEGWRPKNKSEHLTFGGHYASALERYAKLRAQNYSHDEALRVVVARALHDTWVYELDDEGNPLPGTGTPWESTHNTKTRETLIRSIVWYLEHFLDDPAETVILSDGSAAVEHSFSLPLNEDYLYCGHIDKLVTYSGGTYVMDQKAQPLSSRVLTPSGWTTIGELSVGDLIATRSGEFVSVSALHPKGVTKAYRVFFNDGSFVECAEDHLWDVATQFESTFTTRPMTELLHKKPHVKYHVPLCEPIQHPEVDLPLHPYLLGVLLGDGYLNGSSIQLSTTKDWLVEKVRSLLPEGDRMKKASQFNNSWTISGGATLAAIKKLNLRGSLAYNKFVPSPYLFASVAQRKALLQGLLDTDGSWNGKSRIFDSTSLKLVEAVVALVRSLGGTARYRDRRDTAYRVSIRLPYLPTGVGKRYITTIERIADTETMCISVDHPSGLYITDNYTVTHNTTGNTITAYFFDQFNPDVQMGGYTWAGKQIFGLPVSGVLIDAAQIAVGFTRFARGFVHYPEALLAEWYETTLTTIEEAKRSHESNNYPMRRSSCGNYGGCAFRRVCSRHPQHRETILHTDFQRSPRWDPLQRR